MNRYHITTKIAIVLDIIIIIGIIVTLIKILTIGPGSSAVFILFFQQVIAPTAGVIALCLSISGHNKQRTKLGFVLIIINVLFIIWGLIAISSFRGTGPSLPSPNVSPQAGAVSENYGVVMAYDYPKGWQYQLAKELREPIGQIEGNTIAENES